METTYKEQFNKIHIIKRESPTHQKTVKQNIPTPFRPIPQILDYEPQFIDPQYKQDLF